MANDQGSKNASAGPVSGAPDSGADGGGVDDMTFNTTPNQLTLLRMAFVPFVVGLMMLRTPQWDVVGGIAFTIAAITDYFDGYLARSRKQETVYGKLLDPLADKFLVASSLIILESLGRIPPVVVILLICREMAITGLRALASAEGVIIAASRSAKWKTGTQMVAIPLITWPSPRFSRLPLYPIGMTLLYISLGISLWSAQDYVVAFLRGLKEARRHKQARAPQRTQSTPPGARSRGSSAKARRAES